ncbi:DUF3788 family protein [Opitutus sp. ER46]|uniref:DUF3788 family protein n=1 Tax=Opitutus sp. ER46 TaxID=2161864 RepID=UPI000D306C3F|nr:DUF3788 family protein [Opitutus sp. ER46]PTX94426.1 hypothetical protein DB354_11795 [Opitutus sp. ER46]
MKTIDLATEAMPAIAFSDPQNAPTNEAIVEMVGAEAHAAIAAVNHWLETSHQHVTHEWRFSQTSGWYDIALIKERRIFYFIPKPGGFLLNIVLSDRAIAALPHWLDDKHITRLVRAAKRYAEGTVFSFAAQTLVPEVAIALLKAKISH